MRRLNICVKPSDTTCRSIERMTVEVIKERRWDLALSILGRGVDTYLPFFQTCIIVQSRTALRSKMSHEFETTLNTGPTEYPNAW